MWPSRAKVDQHVPAGFKDKYPSTTFIINYMEILCQMPKSLHLNSRLFRSYKNHTTLKGLASISPWRYYNFYKPALYWPHLWQRDCHKVGIPKFAIWQMRFCHGRWGIYCRGSSRLWGLPEYTTFLGNKGQMSPDEVLETQSIASLCIHVEREINKIKYFHIWDSAEPFTMFGVVNQIWSLCAMLCNFRNSIIST